MFSWITANLSTILVSAALAGVVAAIAAVLIRNKKKGRHACGCNCGCCPMNASCHREKETRE